MVRARLREGRDHLVGLLAQASMGNLVRAMALAAAGWLAYLQGDHATSERHDSAAVDVCKDWPPRDGHAERLTARVARAACSGGT